MNTLLRTLKRFIPRRLFEALAPLYHFTLAYAGALIYRFPSRSIRVVGVTGTKGKSTTVELVNAILEASGFKTAVLGTVRFKIGDHVERNLYKMTMPGRFFVQKFLRRAVSADCDWVVLEMTSEGAKQFRHKCIDLDALIFTNLAKEHIESHGSYEKYRDAKLSIARALAHSHKQNPTLTVNTDDKESSLFLAVHGVEKRVFSLKDAEPYLVTDRRITFVFKGVEMECPLTGVFNLSNILGAIVFAQSQGITLNKIAAALKNFTGVRGRVELVAEYPFSVVVDYAHTPDSLEALYSAFADKKKICVLGNTGGGRDVWKRPVMGAIAEKYCEHVILTNEDPYDEDPEAILKEMAAGMKEKNKVTIVPERREAIRVALRLAQKLAQDGKQNVNVLLTGKGTDPYIMGPQDTKEPWDDAEVVREELRDILSR